MAAKSLSGGELYFIGEKDPVTRQDTSFVKIGIVRDNDARGTDHRVKEHQTGNPRLIHVVKVISTPVVERIETTLHGMFAPHRLSGEWFSFDAPTRVEAIAAATELVKKARQSEDAMAQAEVLRKQVSQPMSLAASAQHTELHSKIVFLRAQVSAYKDLSSSVTASIESLSRAGIDCSRFLTIQEKKAVERFDEKLFKEMYGELWDTYQVTTDSFTGPFRVIDPKAQRPNPYEVDAELSVLAKQVEELIGHSEPRVGHVEELHRLYLSLLAIQAPLDWELMLAEDNAKSMVGNSSGIEGLFVWKREVTQKVSLDRELLKEKEPKKFGEFVTSVKTRPAVIVAKDRGYFLN